MPNENQETIVWGLTHPLISKAEFWNCKSYALVKSWKLKLNIIGYC